MREFVVAVFLSSGVLAGVLLLPHPVDTSSAPRTVASTQPAAPAATQPAAPATTQPAPATVTPPAPAPAHSHVQTAQAQTTSADDINAGRQSFRKCQACHSLEPGKNLIGPSLAGIFGKPAGQVSGYNYSPAMKAANVTWNAENLNAFMRAPQQLVPKNKMAFPGIANDSERTNMVAFLASTGQPATGPTVAQQPAAPAARAVPPPAASQQAGAPADRSSAVSYIPDVRYTLRSGIAEGRPSSTRRRPRSPLRPSEIIHQETAAKVPRRAGHPLRRRRSS